MIKGSCDFKGLYDLKDHVPSLVAIDIAAVKI